MLLTLEIHHLKEQCLIGFVQSGISLSRKTLQQCWKLESNLLPAIVPVKKTDCSIHLFINFYKLNAVIMPDTYCMTLVEDLLDQVEDYEFIII